MNSAQLIAEERNMIPIELEAHKVEGGGLDLKVYVLDERGNGNASHFYQIIPEGNPPTTIKFQNGSILEVGINGISNESLLTVLIDRLEGFQSGSFACEENSSALFHVQSALDVLKARTLSRIARSVEGTNTI
jgi:hypothetical protein